MEHETPKPETISHIKEKMKMLMQRPAMWFGFDAEALAGAMYGYIDCLNMARHGHRHQSHFCPRGETPRADRYKSWEENVAEIKRIVEKQLNDDRSEPEPHCPFCKKSMA